MPDIVTHSPGNPEFARVIDVARLRRTPEFSFELAPTAAEEAALARLLDAQAVRKVRFSGALRPFQDGWALEGRLGATVVQRCVVTLEPVTTRVDVPVTRRFLPETEAPAVAIEVAPFEEDEVEPLAERIDLGLVAIEALALALPAYPRAAGAALGAEGFAAPGGRSDADDDVKPFAALAALRDKLGNKR